MPYHIKRPPLPELIFRKGVETSIVKGKNEHRVYPYVGRNVIPDGIKPPASYLFGIFEFYPFSTPQFTGWVFFISPLHPIHKVIVWAMPRKKEKTPE